MKLENIANKTFIHKRENFEREYVFSSCFFLKIQWQKGTKLDFLYEIPVYITRYVHGYH